MGRTHSGKTTKMEPWLLHEERTTVDYIDINKYFPQISVLVNKQIHNKSVRRTSHGPFQDNGQAFA
jgi:hypothetical protein